MNDHNFGHKEADPWYRWLVVGQLAGVGCVLLFSTLVLLAFHLSPREVVAPALFGALFYAIYWPIFLGLEKRR